MKKVKYLVVGGGVSGLSFLNFIDSDDYLVIEKEPELGGYCRTIKKDGFTWDYAGHFFHFRNDEIRSLFSERLKDEKMFSNNKKTNIYFDEGYVDFPFQKNIHQLPKDKFIDCLYSLFNREENVAPNNFLDMLYGKFGSSIVNIFLKPYNEKLYAIDLNMLDVEAMGRFFPYADITDIINNFKNANNSSYNNEFLYPEGGAEVFVKALSSVLDENKIKLNEEVINIDLDKKILCTKSEKIEYEYLISSIPLTELNKLTGFDQENEKLTSNRVLVLNLGFNKPELNSTSTHWTYVPQEDINFYRIGYYSNILNQDRLSMYVEVGFKKEEKIDIDLELEKTLSGLKRINVIDDSHKLVSYESIVMDPAYVHISKESEKLKASLLSEYRNNNIHSIGRYGSWTYCSIEDNIIQAMSLAKEIK